MAHGTHGAVPLRARRGSKFSRVFSFSLHAPGAFSWQLATTVGISHRRRPAAGGDTWEQH